MIFGLFENTPKIEFKNLEKEFGANHEAVGIYTVFAATADVVSDKFHAAVYVFGAGSAGAHGDEIHGDVFCANLVNEEKAYHHFEVGTDFVVGFVVTRTFEYRFATIERGMCRHEPEAQAPGCEPFGRIVTNTFVGFVFVNKMYVSVDGIQVGIGKC